MNVNRTDRRLFYHSRSRGTLVERLEERLNHQLTTKEYPLPGCNLKYEYSTLTLDQRPVASGLFRWFRSAISHCNTQNGRELVNEMIRVFLSQKHELPESLQEFVLHEGLIAVCYRVQIEDSQLIRQVLNLLHDYDPTFRFLHNLANFKLSRFPSTGGRTNPYSNGPDLLTFYLEHARRLKLEYDGTRFIDVNNRRRLPVFTAANNTNWKALLRYLQFGARFENVIVGPSTNFYAVEPAITDTIRWLICDIWFMMVKPADGLSLTHPKAIEEYCSNLNRMVHDLCRTLKIILRTVKLLRRDIFEFAILDERSVPEVEVPSERVINHPTVQLMLPTLSQRYQFPMQLQHACRCSIRERLNENWQLPAGINRLPIPNKMKKYLNLLSD